MSATAAHESAEVAQGFGYSNLLQELLLALVGFTGDVFVASGNAQHRETFHGPAAPLAQPTSCNIQLSRDLEWVEESDRLILDELVRLGFHFSAIKQFVDAERRCTSLSSTLSSSSSTGSSGSSSSYGPSHAHGSSSQSERTSGLSMYRRALTSGLTELLDVFQAAVLQLQQLVLSRPAPVLSSLNYFLQDFTVLLPQLHQLVWEVDGMRGAFTGAKLLDLLHARARCGIPVLQSAMQRLLWHCNQVLFRQLSSWMVHGMLVDPHHEFFIRPYKHTVSAAAAQATKAAAAAASAGAQQQLPGGAQAAGAADGADSTKMAYQEWHMAYQVDEASLPACISIETAECCCFIGKAVLLLKQPRGAFAGQELLPYKDTLEFAEALRRLQEAPSFNRVAFERCVEAIRAKVAALLWHLVVVQSDLMTHLAAIKDYFLLAKGDFYHSFLVDARRLMSAPPRPHTADSDVSIPFQQAALKSTAQHDPLFACFRVHWAPQEGNTVQLGDKLTVEVPRWDANWDGLHLEHVTEWPLGLLLTPAVLARYNALFQFLLRMKRVQLRLEEAWQALCGIMAGGNGGSRGGGVGSAGGKRDTQLARVLTLRHHMAHLLTNLQIYIQVDVIEANYSILEQRIRSAQDFAEVERAHANYLHALMQQSFLNTATICRTITSLFKFTRELCLVIEDAVTPGGRLAHERLPDITDGFNSAVNNLYTFLHSSKLQDANKAPHLRQFYLRLNFNNYINQKIVHAVAKASGPSVSAATMVDRGTHVLPAPTAVR